MATAESTSASGVSEADPNRWRALSVLALISFILVLDITVVNVALPHIQRDLKMSQSGLAWVVDGYTLTAGGLLLLGGRLGDLLGRKRMFLIGVAIFTVASILSGAATSSGMLVFSRFLQGMGEAAAAPSAVGLVALLFTDPAERTKALGIFGGVAGLGGTLGPIISGLLISVASWRWIFYVNIPVAVVSLYFVNKLVKESKADVQSGERPDVLGAVLSTAGFTGIVYGFIQAANHAWGDPKVVFPLILGVALLVGFGLLESKISNPLVPLQFFRNRTRVAANGATLIFASVFFTMFFLLTLYLQQTQGWSAIKSGLAYLPFGIGIGAAIGISTGLLPKIGVKAALIIGFLLYSIGIFWLAGFNESPHYWSRIAPALVFMALGSGFCFGGLQNASLHQVSQQDASLGSGVMNALQQLGGSMGLALLASLAIRHTTHDVKSGINPISAVVNGDSQAFYIGGCIMLTGAILLAVFMERVDIHAEAGGH